MCLALAHISRLLHTLTPSSRLLARRNPLGAYIPILYAVCMLD
jgi:hypothetical protein